MGGIIRAVTGGPTDSEKREKRQAQAANQKRADAASALEKGNRQAAESAIKKKRKRAGGRRTVFTSPLGLSESGTDSLA